MHYMKYLFILGRNVELSLAEVFSYFEKEGNKKPNSKYANLHNEKIIGYVGQINYGKNI